jgi:Arc/MetJ family transcription regulator
LIHTNAYINVYYPGSRRPRALPVRLHLRRDFMRTTLNIEDELLNKAAKLTGIREKTSLVRLGLEALIARESGKRLAELGGTEKKLEMIPRRRIGEI